MGNFLLSVNCFFSYYKSLSQNFIANMSELNQIQMLIRRFHDLISEGSIEEVNNMLLEHPFLCNCFHNGSTALQRIIYSLDVLPLNKQIKLMNILMKNGANTTANQEGTSHILVLACQYGCEPDMFDCIVRWEEERNFSLRWDDLKYYTKISPLRRAVYSGSLTLLGHILAEPTFSCYDQTNSPLRLLFDAIYRRKNEVVMFLLNHRGFQRSIYESHHQLYLEQQYFPTLNGSIVDILYFACSMKMFNVVKKLVTTFPHSLKPEMVFVCCHEMLRFHENQPSLFPFNSFVTHISDLFLRGKKKLVWQLFPFLLPLFLGRSRIENQLSIIPLDAFKIVLSFLEPRLFNRDSIYDCIIRKNYMERSVLCCNECEPNRYFYCCDCYAFYD